MNILNVKINGIDYNLKGEEEEEYLIKVSSYVDRKLKAMLESNDKLSTSSAAVLSALNSVDEMFKMEAKCKRLTSRIEQMEKVEREFQNQITSSKKQLKKMEDFNIELKQKIENMTNSQYAKKKDEEIEVHKKEKEILKENVQKGIDENAKLKFENKNLKFELQSAKYKIMEIERKFIDSQINLAKEKKLNSPLKASK
jgi:cell division protein ZapA